MMDLQYTEASPQRIAAFGEHYAQQDYAGLVFETVDEATAQANAGDWICSVSLFGKVLYYTSIINRAGYEHFSAGTVLGIWNELTFIRQAE